MEHAQSNPAIEGLIEERNEEIHSFVSFALLERPFVLQDNLFAAFYFSNNSSCYFIHSKRIATSIQYHKHTNKLCLSVSTLFLLPVKRKQTKYIICISGYEFSHHSNARILHHSCNAFFSSYILFNLALRESILKIQYGYD